MPFRFHRSLKIFPGLKLNLSKGGVSTSVGGRGYSVNFGKNGVRTTVGIPGTGISYTSQSKAPAIQAQPVALPSSRPGSVSTPARKTKKKNLLPLLVIVGEIFFLICLCCLGFAFLGNTYGALQAPTSQAPVRAAAPVLPLASTEILASTELPAFTETPEVLASPTNNVACPPSGGPHQIGAILEVIDGSSAKVIIDGQTYTVKYLGVLSPIPANEYFEYSKQKNAELTQGQIVTLIARENYKDVGDTLPRYVFIGDLFVNLELIKQGYAAWDREAMLDEICTVPFMVAAQAAVDAQAGLFGMPSNDPVAVASTATEQVYIPPTATKRVFVAPTSEVIVPIFTQAPSSVTCCKHCGPNSQPCGNSCISLRYTCHKGQGCACW